MKSKKSLTVAKNILGYASAAAAILVLGMASAKAAERWQPGMHPYAVAPANVVYASAPYVGYAGYAGMVGLDAFHATPQAVHSYRAQGMAPVCKISAGTVESWRPDAHRFSKSVVGKTYKGYDDRKWVDIRRTDLIGSLIKARMDMCKEKGFLAIEVNDLDGWRHETGFSIKRHEQIRFANWLADRAHERGLSIGVRNAMELAPDLANSYDWGVTEDCQSKGTCDLNAPFLNKGKAGFDVGASVPYSAPQIYSHPVNYSYYPYYF